MSRELFVDAVLLLRPVHLDRNLVLRLIDFDVAAIRLQARGNRLNPHFPVRDIVQRGLSLGIGL